MLARLLLGGILAALAWWPLAGPLPGQELQPAGAASSARPPTAKQRQRLEERDRFEKEADALRAQGKLPEAIAAAQKMLAIEREVLGNASDDVAGSLEMLADMHEQRGDFAAARQARREVLQIRVQHDGEGHWRTADARRALAQTGLLERLTPAQRTELARADQLNIRIVGLIRQGKYAEAISPARQAIQIRKELLGDKHPNYAVSLNNLAAVYQRMGSYAQAEPLHRQALAIWKESLGENHPKYADGLNNLAELYEIMSSSHAQAEPLLKQALAIRKECLGENHPDYAQSLSNLAGLYEAMGSYAQAEPLYRKALTIQKKALGEKHRDYAQTLHDLARVYFWMHAYAQAEPLLKQALAIRKEILGVNHPDYAASLNNMALLYYHSGEFAKAEPVYRQVLAIEKKSLGEKHPRYADCLNNLARLYEARRDYAQAEPLFKQALAIRKESVGEKHARYASALDALAILYLDMGQTERARPLAERAVVLTRQLTDATAAVQTEAQQLAMARTERELLDDYLSVPARAGPEATMLYAEVLAWKGAVATRQRLQRALRHARRKQDPQVDQMMDRLTATTRQLASLNGAGGKASGRPGELGRLLEDVERLERALADVSPEFAEQWRRRHVSPGDLRKTLPAGTALVDLLEYDRYLPPKENKPDNSERYLTAFVLRSDRPLARIELGPAAPVTRAVDRWRSFVDDIARSDEAGTQLRKLVWEPLVPALSGASTVLVSPDGSLNRFPWVALPGRKPGSYLLEEAALAVIPVPQLLPERLAGDATQTAAPVASLILVGGVDYGQPSAKGEAVSALPGTVEEANAVRERFRARFANDQALTLEGPAATKEAVSRALERKRWAHLATHGYFAPETLASALATSRGDGTHRGASSGGAASMPPGLLSGLVLAGVNRDRGAGILTAMEVGELDLHGLDTAVLSACNTGRGEEAGGEGVLGLQRAFQTAGAKTVVASLWSVDDAATSVLMEEFYTNLWDRKLPKLEALRRAQLTILNHPERVDKARQQHVAAGQPDPDRGRIRRIAAPEVPADPKRSPPAWWAAFVLSGDWR